MGPLNEVTGSVAKQFSILQGAQSMPGKEKYRRNKVNRLCWMLLNCIVAYIVTLEGSNWNGESSEHP
jgi:hypothetical protein